MNRESIYHVHARPLDPGLLGPTCLPTCGPQTHCGGIHTCGQTCHVTCHTCLITCGPVTHCGGVHTCGQTCNVTCHPSCFITCGGVTQCGGIHSCGVICPPQT